MEFESIECECCGNVKALVNEEGIIWCQECEEPAVTFVSECECVLSRCARCQEELLFEPCGKHSHKHEDQDEEEILKVS